jgi:hypothetical protein
LPRFRTQLKLDSGRSWYEGGKNEYYKAVVTKILDFLFGDIMDHDHGPQTDERFKDDHKQKRRRELR